VIQLEILFSIFAKTLRHCGGSGSLAPSSSHVCICIGTVVVKVVNDELVDTIGGHSPEILFLRC